MGKNILLALLAALSFGASSARADTNPAYGKWTVSLGSGDFGESNVLNLDIEQQQTVFSEVCANYGEAVTASVTVASQLTATQLIVTGSGQDSQQNSYVTCNLEVPAGTASYQLGTDGSLTVNFPAGALTFTRAQ